MLPYLFEEWEARAKAALNLAPFGYIAGGAGAGETLRANREAFHRWQIWPRMLRDVSRRDTSIKLFDTASTAPFLLAPVAAQGIMHPDAERGTARAAASAGIPLILSTMASTPLEEVARLMGATGCWFQLYAGKSRDFAKSLIQRAETAGYLAIVVTVDLPLLGWRPAVASSAYNPFVANGGIANPEAIENLEHPGATWKDINWIRKQTTLPVILKGILHPDDARLALEHGADGIIVSNHGGRQVDGSVAALDALPLVAKAVKNKVPLLMDSGIRTGADILKALALGASAVLVGRPYAYGLCVAGEAGVSHVLQNLMADFEMQMALAGCARIRDIKRTLISESSRTASPEPSS